MLNQSRVLDYIKDNLGFPFQFMELEDDKIIEYFTNYSLREFSRYFPEVRTMALNLGLSANQVVGRSNEYYIYEPEGREILNVVNVYFPSGHSLIFGHPPLGPFSQGELRSWALDVEVAGMIKQFSSYDYTHEFRHPNVLIIRPDPTAAFDVIAVEYERMQAEDLRGIPNEFQVLFCELALADVMIVIGRIRKRYGAGTLRTPFGEIPLEAEILDEGRDKKREIIEKMTAGSLPNVVLDIG